ncbi:MAG TPA: AI-2E family transporter, partial [Polyangiaceae bacterium]|nr:AI-2E family transporter [Polyangiaceae bacterium]
MRLDIEPDRDRERGTTRKRGAPLSATQIVVLTGGALAVVAVTVMTAQVLLVIFGGALLGIVLFDSSRWLAEKLHIPRGVCLAVMVVVGLVLAAISAVLSAAFLSEQIAALSKALPSLLRRAQAALEHVPIARNLSALLANPKLGEQAEKLPTTALAALSGSLELMGAGALVFFVAVYGAAQPELHERALLSVVPQRHHTAVQKALERVRHTLSRWMLGRLVAMLFVGLTSGIAFHLLHIPAAFALAVFAGLLTFVEYAGAIISAIPPLLLALAQGTSTAVAVLVVFTVLHVIEGYVLTPLLARVAVHFPPAFAVASQAIFGVLLGPLGLTFSTPLLVAVSSAVQGARDS